MAAVANGAGSFRYLPVVEAKRVSLTVGVALRSDSSSEAERAAFVILFLLVLWTGTIWKAVWEAKRGGSVVMNCYRPSIR